MASSSNLLDIFTKLITALECPVCYEYVSSPIYQCNSGHILCNKCITSIYICPTCRSSISPSSSRVRSIEHISEFMIFPCRNEGCEEIMSLKELRNHENCCRHANAFGGAMNEHYKNTSLKHKLFLHVEQHIAPFFVTSPSVINVDVGIQTEFEIGNTAEASTSTNFPSQNIGPYLMYGIMQPTEQVFQPNEVLTNSNHQFCGFVSPSSALIDKTFDPTAIVNNFTNIIRKNAHILNLSNNVVGNSTSKAPFGTASSPSSRTVKDSQSVDGLNLKTNFPKFNVALGAQKANISVQNQINFSPVVGVKPSYTQTSSPFEFPDNKSENNTLFSAGSFRTFSVNPHRQIKIPRFRKSNEVTKTDDHKRESLVQRENKFFKTPHKKENLSSFNKSYYKAKSENSHLKFLRTERDSRGLTHKSSGKKFFENTFANHRANCFSLQGLSDELSRAHSGFDKEKNVFVFTGTANTTTNTQKSTTSFISNAPNSGSSTIFTNSNSSFNAVAEIFTCEQTSDPKELCVPSSSTNTIATRSCDTSVTFSLNSSISSPIASTSGTIPKAINFEASSCMADRSSKVVIPNVSSITSQSSSNTLFCNPEIQGPFPSSTTLVTSKSQSTTPVSDEMHTSLITKTSSSFGMNSSTPPSLYSSNVASKLPVGGFNSSTLSSTSGIDKNVSSLHNLTTADPGKHENNSKAVAYTSFNPIATSANFEIPCSIIPISTSVSLSKNAIDTKTIFNTLTDFAGFNKKSSFSSINMTSSSSSNLNLCTTSQINSPHISSKISDLSTTPLLFNNLLKQLNQKSTTVKGFNFGLNSSLTHPLTSGVRNFAFSTRPNMTINSEDIFVFGKSSKSS